MKAAARRNQRLAELARAVGDVEGHEIRPHHAADGADAETSGCDGCRRVVRPTTVLLDVGTHRSGSGESGRARLCLVPTARASSGPDHVTRVGRAERDRRTDRNRRRAGGADRDTDPSGARGHPFTGSPGCRHGQRRRLSRRWRGRRRVHCERSRPACASEGATDRHRRRRGDRGGSDREVGAERAGGHGHAGRHAGHCGVATRQSDDRSTGGRPWSTSPFRCSLCHRPRSSD